MIDDDCPTGRLDHDTCARPEEPSLEPRSAGRADNEKCPSAKSPDHRCWTRHIDGADIHPRQSGNRPPQEHLTMGEIARIAVTIESARWHPQHLRQPVCERGGEQGVGVSANSGHDRTRRLAIESVWYDSAAEIERSPVREYNQAGLDSMQEAVRFAPGLVAVPSLSARARSPAWIPPVHTTRQPPYGESFEAGRSECWVRDASPSRVPGGITTTSPHKLETRFSSL